MRLTVELDDTEISEIQEATGIRKKSPAVKKAVQGYLYGVKRREFLQRVCEGKTDYGMTNEEIEASGTYDPD
jgi:Arc/MetJ family transcription regulator